MIRGLRAIARSERFKRQRSYSAVWLLLAWGGLIVALLLPDGGALSGLNDPPDGPFTWSDTANHYVAAIAAMHDPIDWSAPLAISTLRFPFGSSLLMMDATPIVTLPIRIIWQAGLEIDPAVMLDLWSSAMLLIAPLSVFSLARALGAGVRSSLAAGILATLSPALIGLSLSGSGLNSWPLLALLVGSMARSEAGGRVPGGSAALLAGGLWWCHPYLGALGALLVLLYASLALRRKSLRLLSPLVGSTAGLSLLLLADIRPVDGFGWPPTSYDPGTSALSRVWQLFPDASVLSVPEWGALLALGYLLAQPLLWRRYPLLTISAGAAAVFSFGLIPMQLITATPLYHLTVLSRIFLLPALISVALWPHLFWRAIDDARVSIVSSDRGRGDLPQPARSAIRLLTVFVMVSLTALVVVPSLPSYVDDRYYRADTEADLRAIGPIRDLVSSHRLLLFIPDVQCYTENDFDSIYPPQRINHGLAIIGAEEGVPSLSFRSARAFYDDDLDFRSDEDHDLVSDNGACDYLRSPAGSGVLIALSTAFEKEHLDESGWSLPVTGTRFCSDEVALGAVREVRFCSADPLAIERFEKAIRRAAAAPAP